MTGAGSPPGRARDAPGAGGGRASLRGSSGMLVGYAAAQIVNFVVQVGIVRHLTKEDYGAFAWAMSAVLLFEAVVPLGLDRAGARFLAMYDEQQDHARLFGVMVLAAVVVLTTGAAVVSGVFLLRPLADGVAPSMLAVDLLVVLIALAPVQALDAIVVDAFAVFSRPWAVFVRRYLLHPLSRLLVVVLMIVLDRGVVFLAVGFLVAGAVGLVLFAVLLRRLLRQTGLDRHFSWRTVHLPVRAVAVFCGPVLLGSFVATATTEFPPVVLGDLGTDADVAAYRAVLPFALLNLGVLFSFSTLFTPAASRLLVRGERSEVRDLYWQNAIWVAVLTFPVLAMTTAFARQFTVATLGDRYASSALVLAVLSIGCYVNAVFGFNGITIQLLDRTRWILVVNVVTLGVLVTVAYVSVHLFGTLGAAVAVLVTLVTHNLLKQLGLGAGAGIGVVRRDHGLVLLAVVVLVLALAGLDALIRPPVWLCLPAAGLAWLLLLRATRGLVRFDEVFPEASRFAVTRWLTPAVGGRGRARG